MMEYNVLKVILIGSVSFSNTMYLSLKDTGYIAGVISTRNSSLNSDYYDICAQASKDGIPYYYTDDINDMNTLHWINKIQPDVIYCFGWSRLIKRNLLESARLGVVGYHPAALPLNRGRHPIIWALVLGLSSTASTFFFMDEGADSGDILSQIKVDIPFNYNALDLYEKLAEVASSQVLQLTEKLKDGKYVRIKQDHSVATYWRKRKKEDGKIDFRMTPESIYNLTRALYKPYPGAYCNYKSKEFIVWKTEIANMHTDINIEPGKILAVNNNEIYVKCNSINNIIKITEHNLDQIPEVGSYIS